MQIITDTNIDNYESQVILQFNKDNDKSLLIKEGNRFVLTINIKEAELKNNKIIATVKNISNLLNNAKVSSVIMPTLNDDFVSIASRVFVTTNYRVHKAHHLYKNDNTLNKIAFNTKKSYTKNIKQSMIIGEAMNFTKSLADAPSNICTPKYLATKAQQLAKEHNLQCEILEQNSMKKLGMHALLSVAQGSINPPQLINLTYSNGGNSKAIVLVGKGVTFDSGGISLKPSANMDEMKYDMAGGASVLGVIKAMAMMKAKVNLQVLIPAVENMPAHNATKPGDVVKSMSGQTIEILNTDAEGRLILCDALSYAKKFKPKVVIDVATLTGAVIVALGNKHSGLMGNNQQLVNELITSGNNTQDTVWQLPLDEEFDELLQSNFADIANIGGRGAGSITAGCFLGRFTKDYSWAHLDIAGTAWHGGKQKGATGRPVALLCDYILRQ